MKQKREQLKELSRIVKMGIKEGMYESVNAGLVEIYAQEGHTEIHSFRRWLELGSVVKKGEKALLLWGEPRSAKNQEKKTDDEKDEFQFFPLAYVFSQKQVQPLKQAA